MQSKAQMALGLHYCGLEVVWGSGRPQHCRGSALRSPEFVAPHRGPTASPGPKAAAAAGLAGLKLLMEPPASARGRPGATETRRPIAGLSSPRAHREREREPALFQKETRLRALLLDAGSDSLAAGVCCILPSLGQRPKLGKARCSSLKGAFAECCAPSQEHSQNSSLARARTVAVVALFLARSRAGSMLCGSSTRHHLRGRSLNDSVP